MADPQKIDSTTGRPEPLKVAARSATVKTLVAAVLLALVTAGVIDQAGADAVNDAVASGVWDVGSLVALASALVGVGTLGGGVLSSWLTARKARGEVTPNSSPQTNDGRALIPGRWTNEQGPAVGSSSDPLGHTPEHVLPDDYDHGERL